MKKLSVLLLALIMCFSCVGLTACSSKNSAPERDVIMNILEEKPSPIYKHDNYTGIGLNQRIYSKSSPNLCLVEYSVNWEDEETEKYYAILRRDDINSEWKVVTHIPVEEVENSSSESEVSNESEVTNGASHEGIKKAVMDYYDSRPFTKMWYHRSETVSIDNDDWVFIEIKETEKNKFRVSGTFKEYECNAYGNRAKNPDDKSFDHYVTYYPESGNYDVTYVFG